MGGLVILLACTIQLDHFEFLGVKRAVGLPQKFLRFYPVGTLVDSYLYGMCRHPLMTAQFMMFWIHPEFTVGHLTLALTGTIYIVFAVYVFEEPRMCKQFPKSYVSYRDRTPAFCPILTSGSNSPSQ